MADLHGTDYQIKLKQGLSSAINALATRVQALAGEPHYTTDTYRLYIFDGNNNRRVHGLDMIVCDESEVVVDLGEVVWSGELS